MASIISQTEIDEMLDFSEPKKPITKRCVKCGSDDLSYRFYKKDHYIQGELPFDSEGLFYSESTRKLKEEALERICRNCRYSWLERPLDYKGK